MIRWCGWFCFIIVENFFKCLLLDIILLLILKYFIVDNFWILKIMVEEWFGFMNCFSLFIWEFLIMSDVIILNKVKV